MTQLEAPQMTQAEPDSECPSRRASQSLGHVVRRTVTVGLVALDKRLSAAMHVAFADFAVDDRLVLCSGVTVMSMKVGLDELLEASQVVD
jgi:hypothetical protein